jgi:hypothetical protein
VHPQIFISQIAGFLAHLHGHFVCEQSDYIHYVEGFILAPGFIDLSQLRFWAVDSLSYDKIDDDFSEPGGDDDIYIEGDDKEEGGGGNLRLLDQKDDDADYKMDGSALDIAVFNLVSHSLLTPGSSPFFLTESECTVLRILTIYSFCIAGVV